MFCEILNESLDPSSEGLGLCLGSPSLPSESAESNGCSVCPSLEVCSGWNEADQLHRLVLYLSTGSEAQTADSSDGATSAQAVGAHAEVCVDHTFQGP